MNDTLTYLLFFFVPRQVIRYHNGLLICHLLLHIPYIFKEGSMLYINLFKYHHHYLYCNNDLETKLDILLLKLRMMTQKAGIFELCFDKNKKILTFQEIWIILAPFTTLMTTSAVVLKFKIWQETTIWSHFLTQERYYLNSTTIPKGYLGYENTNE